MVEFQENKKTPERAEWKVPSGLQEDTFTQPIRSRRTSGTSCNSGTPKGLVKKDQGGVVPLFQSCLENKEGSQLAS